MSITLFPHNQTAYDSALMMMEDAGKAAIIHPTGTGKSFIAFKLAQQHPNKRICWLSPSEYIFKTQLENFRRVGDEEEAFENIEFVTYAKLMKSNEVYISTIKPDFIVLDEFHRCGASEWGKGVVRLLQTYPKAKIMGMSATNIRYLDNRRDMAWELFDGNIASEMTLGESVTRGILPAPTYVISVYSHRNELEKYLKRIKNLKNVNQRQKSYKHLEALKRALNKAEGLDVVFKKHIKNKSSKFIVFCSNVTHMKEMADKANEWFSLVDKEPRIYMTYSDNPSASREFQEFKQDNSNHLKLLYCVDMLNEGIHVDDISGVILSRPTISPIIYKQQVGRALSVNKNKNPIIFDIVNNFENLCSISSIQEEMSDAAGYYLSCGDGTAIINSSFLIMDETLGCRELFDKLQESLSSSWDESYLLAKEYYESNGHLNVTKKHTTENGFSLGMWLITQRRVKAGLIPGTLTLHRIQLLEEIGMVWDNRFDLSWERGYSHAKQFFEANGHLDVKATYATSSNYRLGAWITNTRQARLQGRLVLSKERIARLDGIGMIWSKLDFLWERNYTAAVAYFKQCGNLEMSHDYVNEDGIRLGSWLNGLRIQYRKNPDSLSELKVRLLEQLGIRWHTKYENQWEKSFIEAMTYYKVNSNLNVPTAYTTESGFALGKWLGRQRDSEKLGKLCKTKHKRLSDIGMIWHKADPWELRYNLAKSYFKKHGHLQIPAGYVSEGVWLGKWLYEQKRCYRGDISGKNLTPHRVSLLEEIGIIWHSQDKISDKTSVA